MSHKASPSSCNRLSLWNTAKQRNGLRMHGRNPTPQVAQNLRRNVPGTLFSHRGLVNGTLVLQTLLTNTKLAPGIVGCNCRQDLGNLRTPSTALEPEPVLRHTCNFSPDGKRCRCRRRRNIPHVKHISGALKLKIVNQRAVRTKRLRANS